MNDLGAMVDAVAPELIFNDIMDVWLFEYEVLLPLFW